MKIVRPCKAEDLSAIERLVTRNAVRITSMPHDREKLSARLDYSIRSFAGDPELAGAEFFLFVLEDVSLDQVLGVCGISASAGNGTPFYNYRIDELIHASSQLAISREVPVLYLTHALTGKSVLSSFAIAEACRGTEDFALLSRARLLFIRAFPEVFSEELIVEVQGQVDEAGDSPFWDSLGRHFFQMDYPSIEHYQGIAGRHCIAEVMPPQPIYVDLLSQSAQAAIGQADEAAAESFAWLVGEGFRHTQFVDIFDGGPTLSAQRDTLLTIREAQDKTLRTVSQAGGKHYLLANQSFDAFRCVVGQLADGLGEVIRVSEEVAEALEVNEDEDVSFVAL